MDEIQPSLLDFLPRSWAAWLFAHGRNGFDGISAGSWLCTFTWPDEPSADDPALIDYLSSRYIDAHYYTVRIDEMRVHWIRPAEEVAHA